MKRKIIPIARLQVLVQVASNRWEWISPTTFNGQEPILLKADGYYVPVKF